MRNITSSSILIALLVAIGSCANAQNPEPAEAESGTEYPHWLAERAAQSDVVVVAQLERTDYTYRRGFPVDGRTWFRVIFDYKTPREMERLIVLETGLKPDQGCYFPDISVFEEQPRYLLFLAYDEETALRGHRDGCAVQLAVNDQGRYAAIWPQPTFNVVPAGTVEDVTQEPEPVPGPDRTLEELIQEMEFQGPSARIDGSQMLAHQRRAQAEAEQLRIEGTDLIRTRGIELSELRKLMSAGLQASEEQVVRDQQRRIDALRKVLNET